MALRVPSSIRVATDCSGLDVPVLSLRRLGVKHTHIFSCDNAAAVQKVIKHCLKPTRLYTDIISRRLIDDDKVDLYIAGCPCQPFSAAGKHAGKRDPRCLVQYAVKYVIRFSPRAILLRMWRASITSTASFSS